MPDRRAHNDERSPLLRDSERQDNVELLELGYDENPRNWSRRRKLANVAVISAMAILSPLASSMFTPGIKQIAEDLNTSDSVAVGATTGYVVFFGIGPLILAPLSETFGRRKLYLICFAIFTLLQIPTALAPNIVTLLAMRTIAGFPGSIGLANGGGTLSDMFGPEERAGIFGWYLLGPLLGPTLGPALGGLVVEKLGWRWVFWILTIICAVTTLAGYFSLEESYVPALLTERKREYERMNDRTKYSFEGEDQRPLKSKLATSLSRPFKILSHPIVLVMSVYQALIFSTTYSLYTNMEDIYAGKYGFSITKVGLLYLFPGGGMLVAVWFLVPRIDTIYNKLAERNGGKAVPEYRLPLANIGAILIPISLFWFAWTVDYHLHWSISIVAAFFYGIGQVTILNATQNYYIDFFEKYAASAIAAGSVFRSIIGGTIPLFAPGLFDSLGYGWGVSVFAFVSVVLGPAPLLFYLYGGKIRERFVVNL